jgi:hypothetical protein
LVIDDSIGKTVRGVEVFMVLSNLSVGKTFITCIVGRSFAAVFPHETRDVIVEGMIYSAAAPICLFNVSLLSSDLNQS